MHTSTRMNESSEALEAHIAYPTHALTDLPSDASSEHAASARAEPHVCLLKRNPPILHREGKKSLPSPARQRQILSMSRTQYHETGKHISTRNKCHQTTRPALEGSQHGMTISTCQAQGPADAVCFLGSNSATHLSITKRSRLSTETRPCAYITVTYYSVYSRASATPCDKAHFFLIELTPPNGPIPYVL